ncbi:unnamed protein product [Sphagnum jensenii]|uniref:Uncharacterized protein n=1 Tax=Sphagnum jensenii TaxID=128206 RepID=A0ABP0VU69_9BRYO
MFQASNSQPTKHGNRSHERNPDEESSAVSFQLLNACSGTYIVPVSSILQSLQFWISSMISSMRMKKLMLAFAVPVSGFPLKFHPCG